MNGIHDIGGMHGFGPLVLEENEPVFHEPWEGRVMGIPRALGMRGISRTRYDIEQLAPEFYLRASYYERWLEALTLALLRKGVVSKEELGARIAYYQAHPDADVPRLEDPSMAAKAVAVLRTVSVPRQETGQTPRYLVGDHVRARNIHPSGHTRLPRYIRGRVGSVAGYVGLQGCPDTVPPTGPPGPQPLYSVRFTMEELWGPSAEPAEALYIDMWESYIEPIDDQR